MTSLTGAVAVDDVGGEGTTVRMVRLVGADEARLHTRADQLRQLQLRDTLEDLQQHTMTRVLCTRIAPQRVDNTPVLIIIAINSLYQAI